MPTYFFQVKMGGEAKQFQRTNFVIFFYYDVDNLLTKKNFYFWGQDIHLSDFSEKHPKNADLFL